MSPRSRKTAVPESIPATPRAAGTRRPRQAKATAAPETQAVAPPRRRKTATQPPADVAPSAAVPAALTGRRPRKTAPAPAAVPEASAAPSRRRARSAPQTRDASAPDLSQAPLDAFTLGLPPRTLIAPNFRLYELTKSDLALRLGIDNAFETVGQLRAAVHLARHVLQPVRDTFGSFTPNSVFRGQKLERALKKKPATWLSTSQHAKGEACDIEIVAKPTLELAIWARDHLPEFDQIICECYDPREGPNSGWVHISLKAPGTGTNRRKCLSYVVDGASGKLVYVEGLQASVA